MDCIIEYYKGIKDLPLTIFIECCVNKNYGLLIKNLSEIEGKIQALDPNGVFVLDSEQTVYLGQLWVQIMSDFYDTSQDPDMKKFIKLTARLKMLEWRQLLVNTAVEMLGVIEMEGVVKALRMFHDYPFTKESMKNDLRRAKNMENNFKQEMKAIETELAAMSVKEGKTASEADFYDVLLAYEEVKKVPIMNKDTITVFWYAMYKKNLIKAIEAQSKIQ